MYLLHYTSIPSQLPTSYMEMASEIIEVFEGEADLGARPRGQKGSSTLRPLLYRWEVSSGLPVGVAYRSTNDIDMWHV